MSNLEDLEFELRLLRPTERDILVCYVTKDLSAEVHEHFHRSLQKGLTEMGLYGKVKCLVVTEGVQLHLMTAEELTRLGLKRID